MEYFGTFYLDKEKDMIVTLQKEDGQLYYLLETPNHGTGNLITNFAKICNLEISYNQEGYKVIWGRIPCFYDGENHKVYILRLANTKVANIYPDGTIERKAYIPAIAKTFMSQTKDYNLDIHKTLVKTYIHEELKFHSDLHTHLSANLTPDLLIALGIYHQIIYPYYYIKKLKLKLTEYQYQTIEKQRKEVAKDYQNSELTGKYLDRKIDDHTYINFADLILNNLENSSYNIAKIRASLAVMKDGQAVFTNLEKVYLYRYVFTKGIECKDKIDLQRIDEIPDQDIVKALKQMNLDRDHKVYRNNTLYQDKLLWIARSYQQKGIIYAEISDTSLVKAVSAPGVLKQIHEVMPSIIEETGVVLRFLGAFRRIPLTIIKDSITKSNFSENLQVLAAIVNDPYIAGSDFVGEEINDIRELKGVIREILTIAKKDPGYVLRVHAGENDSLKDNVLHTVKCIEDGLDKDQYFPHVRIGHGLYTANLKSNKGKELLALLKRKGVVLEFQITSNVRLNNLSELKHHPLKQYLHEGILCVQGTDGGALYGTDSIDEQLSLERMLELDYEEIKMMHDAESMIIQKSLEEFEYKKENFKECKDIEEYYKEQIKKQENQFLMLENDTGKYSSEKELADSISPLIRDAIPIVVAGGSYNNIGRNTIIKKDVCDLLDDLLEKADPTKIFFVLGPTLTGYEKYLYEKGKHRFTFYCFVPATISALELNKIKKSEIKVRVAIESSQLGVYKSIAYEIFKQRQSIILCLDGNSAASNLIQDAKNSKYKSRTFISESCKTLRLKAESLQGYVTMVSNQKSIDTIIDYADRYYDALNDETRMLLKK